MLRLRDLSLLTLLAPAIALVGCPSEDTGETEPEFVNTTVELQDIFIPDRLIELPVLPEGTVVVNEVPIHNAGDRDLLIDEVALNYQSDDNWTLNVGTVPDVIAPHEVAVVEVVYTAIEGIDTFASLDVYSDDPDEAEKTVAFIARGASGGPEARVSENIIDFGFQFTGEEKRRIVEIRNEGDEDLMITGVELVQSEEQPAFALTCPGVWPLEDCDFETEQMPAFLTDPVLPGSAVLLEVAFTPLNLQGVSAQLKVHTSDPLRETFNIFLAGNGDSAVNCTPPSITVVSPSEATFFHSWQQLQLQARVVDAEQPPESLYVEMFLGDLRIEDEFPGTNGLVSFDVDIDEGSPPVPSGLQTLTLKVSDGCPLFGYDVFVAAIDFQISQSDTDGDGYDPNQGDCDDSDRDIFPQNVEVFDGKDNDCDGVIDESTQAWDDDGDCFCEVGPCLGSESINCASVEGGDCNDINEDLNGDGDNDGPLIFPGQIEGGNFVDDNCNGITDEGTAFFDDDGDGQTESSFPNTDCDDDDPTVFSGAIEWCDGIDNDCNIAIDDECTDPNTPPRIVGGVITDRFQVELGSRVNAQVLVVSLDDQLEYEWLADKGVYDEPANGASVFWTAPEEEGQVGSFANLYVTVSDSLGQSDTAFGDVLLSRDILVDYAPVVTQPGGGANCSALPTKSSPSAWALLLGVLGLAAIRRRL
ncbi:MAG: putative metal-binding motif-containing protein [Deltaproteobacteria bacterium]|nr:putative metal-binding motif-containing protein [Deltaproteobacteria bacterium]